MSREIFQENDSDSTRCDQPADADSASSVARREAAGRSRADSNSCLPPIARSGSTVSTSSQASYASSLAGNRDSIISNGDAPSGAAVALSRLPEEDADSDSNKENDNALSKTGDSFEVTTRPITQGDVTASLPTRQLPDDGDESRACLADNNIEVESLQINSRDQEARGSASYSQQVPTFNSTLDNEDDVQFLLVKTCCHREKMHLKDFTWRKMQLRPVYSPVFIIKKYRYYACLLVQLSDEIMSVGIRLMKGKEDKNLVWPFNMIVMFRLKNLNDGQDVVKMFRSDRNASRLKESVWRPKTDMNAPIGFQSFISKQRLEDEGFVRNDQIRLDCYFFPRDAKIDHVADYPSVIKQ